MPPRSRRAGPVASRSPATPPASPSSSPCARQASACTRTCCRPLRPTGRTGCELGRPMRRAPPRWPRRPARSRPRSLGGPAYLQQAYDVAALAQSAGGNQTIAIVDAYDSPNAESDLATYRCELQPAALHDSQRLLSEGQRVRQPTAASVPAHPLETGWGTEIALDLAAVSAICPNCKIELVEAFSDGIAHLAQAQYAAAHMTPTPDRHQRQLGRCSGQRDQPAERRHRADRGFENTAHVHLPGHRDGRRLRRLRLPRQPARTRNASTATARRVATSIRRLCPA